MILALFAPVVGAAADFRGNKNRLFNLFFAVGVLSLFASVFLDDYYALLAANLVMIFGYTGTYVLYDAFQVDVSPDERMDCVSSFGYGIGYIGLYFVCDGYGRRFPPSGAMIRDSSAARRSRRRRASRFPYNRC